MEQKAINLQRGDIFCIRGDTLLARIILWGQALFSQDGKADYSHTGIILDPSGKTLEALSTIRFGNLWESYKGFPIIIGRHQEMSDGGFCSGLRLIADQIGKRYPWWRLISHLNPSIAIHINPTGRLSCAALACKFLFGAGLLSYFNGMTPDTVAEMIVDHKKWAVVYKGRLQ